MATVRIDGVEFELDDAREFGALIYAEANPPMSPDRPRPIALAMQIEVRLRDKGSFEVTLDEKVVARAVLDEWLQSRGAPDAARALHHALAS